MALSTYLANKLLDHAIGKTSFTMPATPHLALYVSDPTDANSGTEASYTGYARVAIPGASIGAASGKASTNTATINFPAKTAGADQTVTHWGILDAASGGNLLEFGALTAPKLIENTDAPYVPIGDLDRSAA